MTGIKELAITCLATIFSVSLSQAQSANSKPLTFKLNDNGSHYIKVSVLGQVWLRHTDFNPGTTVFGNPVDNTFDIGIRRLRVSAFAQISDKVAFYTQFGQNNFSYMSAKYTGAFLHDAVVEYQVKDQWMTLGTGLTGWSGMSRYASPSVGKLLSLDAPLYQQATNSISDQFLRKLSVYAKGKISKLDYRIALTKPMAVENSTVSIKPISSTAEFATQPAEWQQQGYFMYQFLDQESNQTPYTVSTYLGTKRVFNLGVGIIRQANTLWSLNTQGDTSYHHMQLLGVDLFYDSPLNTEKQNAFTAYAAFNLFDFGPDYLRNVGVMNPANGNSNGAVINGAGNGLPMIGTGQTVYAQVGYVTGKSALRNGTRLQPYLACQWAQYEALDDNMLMYEGGVNWLIHGSQGAKISLNYQSRPVFETTSNGSNAITTRKGMIQLQYQLAI